MATFSLSNNPTTSVTLFWPLGGICQGVTANVGTEGASENFLFGDVFKELLVTQSVLHRFG
jgi:hypothetical protein